ncbi:S8 family serine peptidase [Nocardioides sp.]|uniref:S8 family peptidase n=1 Tax=Nocardioides sp. TaxID=35761 RepID=UPI00356B2BCA
MPTIRTRLLALTSAVAATTLGVSSMAATPASAAPHPTHSTALTKAVAAAKPGLTRLIAHGTTADRAIVTFNTTPSAAQIGALRSLGLVVQPLKTLPMALVAGPTAALVRAAEIGADVYPNETLSYSDTESSNAMSSSTYKATKLRAKGLTGKGVTVGVVDSGCDGTHPDLADHITHNVTLISPEYLNAGTSPQIVIPMDQGPYNNTDLGSGHGTHVAGIIAADGTSGPDALGVAPDADLACFAIGAVITTTAVVTAYDYAMSQPKMLGIDVFNNSWGNSFRQYDPKDPVNVATKAATARGATVVFAAGNAGEENGEGSTSPFNQAPWVISVAAGTVKRERGSFSSNGLEYDNGTAVPIGANGHTAFLGDRVGNTIPDIMAPGVSISSSCDSTGTVIGPCPDHGQTSASGTSMASPHIAGAAAVLKQAKPKLSPMQIQRAMTATATPVLEAGKRLLSWQVGYGHINLDKAVKLVTAKKKWKKKLRKAQKKATRRLAREDVYRVVRSDLWQEDAPALTLGGSYSATHKVRVTSGTKALKVTVIYPSTGQVFGNLALYSAVVKDASGKTVGETTSDQFTSAGLSKVLVKGLAPGVYSIEVSGDYAASDPDTLDSDSLLGRVVFVQAAQLATR